MNRLKTMMMLAALTALFLWIGRALGGQQGMMMALVFAGLMNFFAYWFSDTMVLKMYGAQPLSEADAPELFSIVQQLSMFEQVPMPKLYLLPQRNPNAFATGRNPAHAAVAVTAGIMDLLDREELKGVLGHEMSHVKNRDTLVSTVAAALAGALSMLSNMAMWGMMGRGRDDRRDGNPMVGLIGIIIAPLAASLIQLAISRSREFLADESGAKITGNPLALASALRKIENASRRLPMTDGSPATAHLFIINPFKGQSLAQLFSTHPSTEERIKRLEQMVKGN